ncbi:hypothetical protein N752_05640 [Desulforamulus aquiferis]|nr:hypothetical protein N752_05640 [Desulforamulus aquiferis]
MGLHLLLNKMGFQGFLFLAEYGGFLEVENVQKKKIRVARLSIISNTTLTLGKLWVGLAMGSAAVISEAIHSGLDLIAAIIAFLAVRQSGKPADEKHPYGHGKFENLASIIEALLIIAAAIGIFVQAVPRLLRGGGEIHSLGLGAAVMVISALVNIVISRILIKTGKETESPALSPMAGICGRMFIHPWVFCLVWGRFI